MHRIIFLLLFLFITNSNLFPNESCGLNLITFYANTNSPPDTAALEEKIHVTADEMPRFLDKEPLVFISWIRENMNYPMEILENRIEGRVYIQFIIDKTGELKDAIIARGVHELLDTAILNTAKLSPRWIPGKIDDTPVNVIITLAINIDSAFYNLKNQAVSDPNYIIIDEFPSFMGKDMEYFGEWVSENLKYPRAAYRRNIEGEVIISFIINEEGILQDINLEKSVHPLLDEESLRVINSSPKWEPAKKDGKNISYSHSVSVDFTKSASSNVSPLMNVGEVLKISTKINDNLYYRAEKMPKFRGEDYLNFQNYIQSAIVYSDQFDSIPGLVRIQFDLNNEGVVTNPKIIESLHPLLDAEALRIIVTSPKWEPAQQGGVNVGVRLTFPVYFFMEPTEKEDTFVIVEDMPTFKGGDLDYFREHINQNLKYPKEAADKGIQGRVFIQFVVDVDGSIKDVVVIRGVYKLLDEEAVRVIQSSPKWEPGKQKGKPVRVRFIFPINFVLEKNKK